MGKYLKEKIENQEELRKERKLFYQLFIVAWFFVALSVAMAKIFPSPEPGYWTVAQLLIIITGIVAFVFTIKCFIALKKITKIIYSRGNSFFILYLVLLVGGFATGIFWIIPLILIWVHSKKLLLTKNINS